MTCQALNGVNVGDFFQANWKIPEVDGDAWSNLAEPNWGRSGW